MCLGGKPNLSLPTVRIKFFLHHYEVQYHMDMTKISAKDLQRSRQAWKDVSYSWRDHILSVHLRVCFKQVYTVLFLEFTLEFQFFVRYLCFCLLFTFLFSNTQSPLSITIGFSCLSLVAYNASPCPRILPLLRPQGVPISCRGASCYYETVYRRFS